ncbi:GntR family transcriptional regulator [Saccharopolyspora phatthalungensis]|uniref:GntR family transcriptional regulator n=1 Tax=Saccharopolyspora phatthalungensis TaxID=664693 RepID=A0A840QKT5_9PSEU|nr:GntR family transcriptional regulator [Saccharopolyspora phatthalungensis]MBB5159363.1 GntR family transcriptional regulator [Saccharopolyspora phatthalungensis]
MELHSRLPDRVAEVLRARIRDEYEPGRRLPSETVLAEELNVSRASVREALKQLFAEGLVDRRWGAGTFVRELGEPVAFDVSEVSTTREVIRSAGHEPTLSFVDITVVPGEDEVLTALGLDQGADVWKVERVFAIDAQPAVLIIDHLAQIVNGAKIDPTVLKDVNLDMMTLLRREANTHIASSEGTIDAVAAAPLVASRLGIAEGTPVLRQRLMNIGPDGMPLMHSVSHHRSDVASFRVLRRQRS